MTVPRVRTYEVTVQGFASHTRSALSRSKARYDSFLDFSEAYQNVKFGEFVRLCSVRLVPTPDDDGYAYVRRNYGVEVHVGQRIVLVDEGLFTGRAGEVIYPGQSTAHIHVILDGEAHRSRVHPLNFQPEASQ